MVADHIDHIRKIAGIDHIGIGGDFDGIDTVVEGLEDVSEVSGAVRRAAQARLQRRGRAEDRRPQRAARHARPRRSVAQRLQKARGPSKATIEALDGAMR